MSSYDGNRKTMTSSSYTSYSITTKGTVLESNVVRSSETFQTSGIMDEVVTSSSYYEEDSSLKEIKSGRGDHMVEITEITTPDIDEVSISKKLRLDFDDIMSAAEPILDNSLALHKISIRPKKTRHITTSVTKISGVDEETILDATTAQIVKEATLNELIETEEEFVRDLKYIMKNYYDSLFDSNLNTSSSELAEAREVIFGNLKLIYEFHDGVLLEGLKYYSKEPKMIGRTFVRLERDFDKHVTYCRDEPTAQEFLKENPDVMNFFEDRRESLNDEKTILEHLKLPIQRLNDYQVLLGDLLHCCEYGSKSETSDLNRALELITTIPQKTTDLKFLNSIEGYPNIHSLGRLIKHDWFGCNEESDSGVLTKKSERYLFLFKSKILVTKVKRISDQRSIFILKDILKLPDLKITEENIDFGKKQLKISVLNGRKTYILEKTASELNEDGVDKNEEFWLKEVNKLKSTLSKEETSHSFSKERSFEEVISTDTEEKSLSFNKGDLKEQKNLRREDSDEIKTDTSDTKTLLQTVEENISIKTIQDKIKGPNRTTSFDNDTTSIKNNQNEKPLTKGIDNDGKVKRTSIEVKPIQLIDGDTLANAKTNIKTNTTVNGTEEKVIPIVVDNSLKKDKNKVTENIDDNKGSKDKIIPIIVDNKSEIKTIDEQKRLQTISESKPIETIKKEEKDETLENSKGVSKNIERDSTTRKSIIKKDKSIEGEQNIKSVPEEKKQENKMSAVRKSSNGNIILVRRDSVSNDNSKPRPELFEALKSIECEPGDGATFTTKIDSKSPCSISWLKDNRPLQDKLADRFKISQNGNTYKLSILNCIDEDTGLYTVKAVNEFGNSVTSSAQLLVHVLSKEERQKRADDNSPYFNVKFQDTELLLETTVCLMVDVKGDPVPSIKFYKDDIELKFNDRIQLEKNSDHSYDLRIHSINDEDAGTYKCVASNYFGKTEFESHITVTSEKDLFSSLEGKRLLEPGEEPNFNWFRDGKSFEPEERFKVMFKDEEDTLALVFQHVKPEDAGLYTCVASTSSGKISCSAELTVQGAVHQLFKEPEPPQLITGLSDAEAGIGSTAMFELAVTGFPKPNIAWIKDGKEINTGEAKYKVLHEDDNSTTLLIKGVSSADAGSYRALITNDLGEVSSQANLVIKSPPSFKTKIKETIYGLEGESLKINIDVDGNPKPTIIWYKDGIEQKPSNNLKFVDNNVIIDKVSLKEHSGNWSILATNSQGQMSQFFNLIVNKPPKITRHLESKVIKSISDTVEYSITIEEGMTESGEKIIWSKDGIELKNDTKSGIIIEKESSTEYKLKLNKLKRDDSSRITCEVSNDFGKDSSGSNLLINREPVITKKLKPVNIKDSGEALFDIKVDAFPKPKVKWFLDGIEINSNKYDNDDDAGSYKLKLPSADISGKIIVKAENDFGYAEDSTELNVLCKPSFLKGLKDVRVVQDTQLDLCVVVKGNPSPTISWFHNGNEVSADARIKITKESTENFHCTFNVILPSDNGEWEVKAKNEFGESSSKCIITVEGKPIFEKRLKDIIEVIETENLQVDVAVAGEPKPVIKWFLNSTELTRSECTQITVNDIKSIVESELIIKNITINEESTEDQILSCHAINKYGEIETSAKLKIISLNELKRPKIIDHLQNIEVMKGNKLLLKLNIKGNPTSVQWFLNGKEIKGGTQDKDGNYVLIVDKVNDLNDGEYTVIAKNEFGSDQSKATVTVNSLPEIIGLKDICIVPGDKGEFKAEIKCKPKLQSVQWFNPDGVQIKDGIEEDSDGGIYKLCLQPLDKSFEGNYKLKAKNILGESEASARLKMQLEPPSFSKGLIDIQLKEKESLELKVRYQGLPHPNIIWKHDDIIIKSGDEAIGTILKTDELTSSLTIENINKSDFGKYEVIASNMGGEASTSCQVKIIQTKPQFLKSLPRKQELSTGADLILEIKIDGSPTPTIIWYKDGIEIGKENLNEDGTVLTIPNVQEKDKGIYSVIIKNDNGEEKSNCSVDVIKKKSKPELIKPFGNELNICEGQPIILESIIKGYPEPMIKWFKDGKPIKNPFSSTSIIPIDNEQYKIILNNNNTKKEDSGIYSIQISNEKGSLEDSIMVNVQDPLIKPKFIKTPENELITMANFPIKLEYKILSNPKPELKLLFNGNEMNLIKPYEFIESKINPNEYNIIYLIPNPTKSSEGIYSLNLKNQDGTITSPETNVILNDGFNPNEEETEPILLTPLKSQEINEGTDLYLKIKLCGNPIPNIKWSVNGDEIKNGILFDGTWTSLTIKDCNPNHSGLYKCEINNKCGQDSTEGDIKVLKVFEKPCFIDKFEDTEQIPTRDCKMSARISGNPYPNISWFKNDIEIKDSLKYKLTSDQLTKMISLIVKNCCNDDIGIYSCILKNRIGEDKCNAKLDVRQSLKDKEEPPYFLKKITDTDLYEGMIGKFTACIGGFPTPTYEWYKNNKKINEGDSSKYKFECEGLLLRLIIKSITIDDIGDYRLKIKNNSGEISCNAKLNCEGNLNKKTTESKPSGIISNFPIPLLERPIISCMTDRYLTLSWKPSLQMGDFRYPITYQVEMCEGSIDDENDNWFTIHKQLKHNICDIKNLKPGVDYKFRIRVENKYGISGPSPFAYTLRSKIYIPSTPNYSLKFKDFKYEGYQHEPKFLNEINEQYGIHGIGTQVIWYLYGCPTPEVKFLFNGLPTPGLHFTYSTSGELILFINRMNDDDVGKYEAIAWNEHGEARQNVKLLMAEHPRFIKRLEEKWIMLRDGFKLSATVSGIPKPTIKWFKDWKMIGDTSRLKINEIDNGNGTWDVTLELTGSILKDEGLYSISASNVAGGVSSSATLHVEENEDTYNWKTYSSKSRFISPRNKSNYFNYIIGDELGRGTQGIVHHVIDRNTGESYASKSMKTNEPNKLNWMKNELNIMKDLNHRNIIRLYDVYQSEDSNEMKLIQEYFSGGEILNLLKRNSSEYEISKIIKEILLGLKYLHDLNIGHLSLTPRDILFSHAGNEINIKLIDFGLARIIDKNRLDETLDYGQPEYVAPEIINHESVGLEADIWSLGIISSLLLTGKNFYQGINDMETLINIQTKEWTHDDDNIKLSNEAYDFLSKMIVRDPKRRMTIDEALEHPFLNFRENSKIELKNKNLDYIADLNGWYKNASCKDMYRRRPLEGAFTHSSKMVYPPYDDVDKKHHERNIDTTNYKRPNLEYELGNMTSESHYQCGPDTYLLQLRDADFPARLRRYMKFAASRSPSLALQLKGAAIDTSHTVIRERRKFTDIMDEEVDDERKERISHYGPLNSEPRRLRHEIGPDTSHYATDTLTQGKDGTLPILREKPNPAIEYNLNDKLDINVISSGEPEPIIQWFKNDLVMSDTSRVKIIHEEGGKSSLQFGRLVLYDTGLYKVVARNKNGSSVSKFKLYISDGNNPIPEFHLSNLDYNIETNPIELSIGNPIENYSDLNIISKGNYSYLTISKNKNKMIQIIHKEIMDTNIDLVKTLVNVNISNLINYYEIESTIIYVKEYCGDLLLNYLSEQINYTEDTLCNISGQVLDGLNYLHWRGWVLMNLNPNNVVYDGHRAKLVDFTCSQQINATNLSGRNPQSLLEFNAPEQLSNDVDSTVIPQTDIWAFGVLLYICLSGVSPFKGANTDETKQNIQFVRFRFEHLFKGISQEATKLFIQLFKRSPLKRPSIEECFDTRWFSPSDFMHKRREKAIFHGHYLKEYVEEYKRNELTSEVIERTIRTILK